MTLTLTEQIEQALKEGRLSFTNARKVTHLWNNRRKADEMLSESPGDKTWAKILQSCTDGITEIIDKSKLSASERLELIEK